MSDITISQRDFPVLVIEPTDGGKRDKLGQNAGGGATGPGASRQRVRLDARFASLKSSLAGKGLGISTDMTGLSPELVIVFEINSSLQSFYTAVRHVNGLEFLAEIEEDEIAPDEDFQTPKDKPLDPRLYVVAHNAKALKEVLKMWTAWSEGDLSVFKTGLAGWKNVFELLRDVREWSPEDRLRDTHLHQDWQPLIDAGAHSLTAEVELWFRGSEGSRASQRTALTASLELAGARVIDAVDIPEIAYHALLVEVSAEQASAILNYSDYLVTDRSIASIRPQMVGGIDAPSVEVDIPLHTHESESADLKPLVALLDGVPLESHNRLDGRLEVNDPLDASSTVPAAWRVHGTAMSSLVVWGDLQSATDPIRRPLFVRPIFEASASPGRGRGAVEHMTSSRLAVGFIRDAIQAMFFRTGGLEPSAPTVRIVVIAAGHTALPFGHQISPWARLLDYYSATLGVLFIVSAGNHLSDIALPTDVPFTALDDPEELRDAVMKELMGSTHKRRLLSPAEGMNVLTVGALHNDDGGPIVSGSKRNVLEDPSLPSPVSAAGTGYRRSIKPDLFANGGRVLYREQLDVTDRIVLQPSATSGDSPGVLVSAPGAPGELSAVRYLHGTSASAGLVGHQAALLAEALLDGEDGEVVPPAAVGIATRALLVNTASWSHASTLVSALDPSATRDETRRQAAAYLGYGAVRPDRVALGAPERITILATGRLFAESARVVKIPVPPSLNGRPDWRRAAVTLSSFTPINPRDRGYRRSKLWFKVMNPDAFGLQRQEADWRAAMRGTLQHELLDGTKSVVVRPGDALEVRVNLAAQAGGLESGVLFALAVTFEMAPATPVNVYAEVEARLRATTRVTSAQIRV